MENQLIDGMRDIINESINIYIIDKYCICRTQNN